MATKERTRMPERNSAGRFISMKERESGSQPESGRGDDQKKASMPSSSQSGASSSHSEKR